MNRFTLFITLLLASIGIGWAQSSYVPVADLQMSTSGDYHFYKIASPRGGFLTLNSDGALKHNTTDVENSYWIVESAGNAANNVYPVYLRNAVTLQYFKFGPAVSHDKSIVYLKATTWDGNTNFPAAQGTVISPNNNGGGNCLDANNTNDGVGSWGAINDGTSWYFAEVSDDEIASIPTNLKSYLGKNSASIGSSLKTPYLTTIGYAKACTVLFDDTNTTTAETAINSIDDFSTSENSFSDIVSAFDNYYQTTPTTAQTILNTLYTTANGKVVALNSVASSTVRMASPAEGSVAKGESTTNYNTVWQILTNNNGQLALKNLATGQYIQQAGSYGNDQAVNQTTSPNGALYYNLILNNQANVVIFNVPNNGNMCIHQGTSNGICYWNDAAGGARWLVSDQSEVAEDAAMLTDYSNQLAAMNAFPAGTFTTEGISIPEITAATPIADITSAAATVPAAMVNAAASADGKVIAFRNTEKAAYIGSPAVADGTLQKVTDQSAPTPATAWMLHHGEGTEFTLSNVLTGFYV